MNTRTPNLNNHLWWSNKARCSEQKKAGDLEGPSKVWDAGQKPTESEGGRRGPQLWPMRGQMSAVVTNERPVNAKYVHPDNPSRPRCDQCVPSPHPAHGGRTWIRITKLLWNCQAQGPAPDHSMKTWWSVQGQSKVKLGANLCNYHISNKVGYKFCCHWFWFMTVLSVRCNVSSRLSPLSSTDILGTRIHNHGTCEQRRLLKWKDNKHLKWSGGGK